MLLAPGATAQDDCVGFLDEPVIAEGTNGVEALAVADLDEDGDLDVLSVSFGDGKLFWYENDGAVAPAVPSFTARLISESIPAASAVHVGDLDGDADPDVLAASRTTNRILWFENDGRAPPSFVGRVLAAAQAATTSAAAQPPFLPLDVFAADMDGDGDLDVLSASFDDDTIAWYENDGAADPTFAARVIVTTADAAAAVHAADMDGDGDLDVLSASRLDDTVAWYENDGAADPAFTRRVLSRSAEEAVAVFLEDLDGDGDRDVLAASRGDDTIAWFRNDGGQPPAFQRLVLSTAAESAQDVLAGDLDGDGDRDVLSASSIPGFPASTDKIAWYENDDGALGQPVEHRIYRSADGAVAVAAADLDGDGDTDVASAGRVGKIAWYENVGVVAPVFVERVVSTSAPGAMAIQIADLDDDGDPDLLSASADDDTIAWYENDGAADPTFVERPPITLLADEAQAIFPLDLDLDGDLDVLSASAGDDTIAWYESDLNGDPAPPSFLRHVVTADALGARSVHAADLDGDGDPDVLAASADDDTIAWYESDLLDDPGNPARPPSFTEHDLTTENTPAVDAASVFAADLDGDGDLDILAATPGDDRLAWYESDLLDDPQNPTRPPTFTRQTISLAARSVSSAFAADLDADEDLDLVVNTPGDNRILQFVNDGAADPTFSAATVSNASDGARLTSLADVDGDGDPDLLAGQRLGISWFRSFGEICDTFDATGDGVTDGVELAWIGRAFGSSSTDPAAEWWYAVDYDRDGAVDGDDLAILATPGVFGIPVADCNFVCSP